MIQLGRTFKSRNNYLKVSCAIGPLSCCYAGRGICEAAPYIDWVFLMLYDGLENNAAFDLPNAEYGIWQDDSGQKFCGITPRDEAQHGIISFVAKGACQFIQFAMYLNWPVDKLVMGLPMYSQSLHGWFEIANCSAMDRDKVQLLTQYEGIGYAVGPTDVTERVNRVLNPMESVLSIHVTDQGWMSAIRECRADDNSQTILGVGFWQIGHEDSIHHELSVAARNVINDVNGYNEW